MLFVSMYSIMKKKAFLFIALLTLALEVATAFVPLARRTVRPVSSALSYTKAPAVAGGVQLLEQEEVTSTQIPQQVKTKDEDKENTLLSRKETSKQLEQPPSNKRHVNVFQRLGSWGKSALQNIRQEWKKWSQQSLLVKLVGRPSNQFRLVLGVGVTTAMTTLVVVHRPLFTAVRAWLQHRGFQGLAALGRSVAYGWALLVGYPRLLDKRAHDKQRLEREHAVEQRRQHLRRLAAEVARLRQELAALDKEMRTFRREIITLQANGIVNEQVQEAIGAEMALLASLRADTQAALQAVRKRWADVRSKSPPELWQEDDMIWLEPSTLS